MDNSGRAGTLLNARQARFVEEYLVDRRATHAAVRAGYSLGNDWSGFYVYFLTDPRCGRIFYVGKGKGRRAFSHQAAVKRGHTDNGVKSAVILDVLRSGLDVEVILFAGGLSERAAFAIERDLIRSLRDSGLTNISGGTVTAAESVQARAITMRRKLKGYDDWAATTSDEKLAQVARVFGPPEEFYKWYVGMVDCLADGLGFSQMTTVNAHPKGAGYGAA